MTNATKLTTYTPDIFASGDFDQPDTKLPRAQFLRGETDPNMFGLFISELDLIATNYKYDKKDLIEYQFISSNEKQAGLMLKTPKMLLAQKTVLMAKQQIEDENGKSRSVYEAYDASIHFDRSIYSPCTGYNIILVDADNKPLHDIAFSLTAKGAAGASLNAELNKFYDEITTAHAKLNNIPIRKKDARFKALCVFEPVIVRELIGDKQKSFSIKINSHKVATTETFTNQFISKDYETIWEIIEPVSPKEYKVLGEAQLTESTIIVRQDELHLTKFLTEFAKQYGSNRSHLNEYCNSNYGVGISGMTNNQLLHAIDVLESASVHF
jgi:hypothetical protein